MNKSEIYEEFEEHLMKDKRPSEYFNSIVQKEVFNEYPFKMLKDLIKIDQSPKYHPEGSVWNHTMLVVDNAAERKELSENSRAFMWAALLHDIGKGPTTKVRKGRITSYDHDRVGAKMTSEFLHQFTNDENFIKKVTSLVRWHMQALFVVKDLPFGDIGKMISEVSIDEMALLCLCDRLGRGDMTEEKIEEEKRNISIFVEKCKKYNEKRKLIKLPGRKSM